MLAYSLLAGGATVLGGIMALAAGRPTERTLALVLGVAGGIMAGVTGMDLLPAAWKYGGFGATVTGLVSGFVLLFCLALLLAGRAPTSPAVRDARYLAAMGYLIATGIALHDLPEGMAIAVGYAATSQLGWIIALSIGLHNIPEGMATAAPLRMAGVSPLRILGLNLLVSLFTPLGTLAGFILLESSRRWIGLLLALAAGAMIYIVFCEILPESRRRHPNYARLGVVCGLLLLFGLNLLHW